MCKNPEFVNCGKCECWDDFSSNKRSDDNCYWGICLRHAPTMDTILQDHPDPLREGEDKPKSKKKRDKVSNSTLILSRPRMHFQDGCFEGIKTEKYRRYRMFKKFQ